MPFSFTWLYVAVVMALLFTIIATIMCFFAPTYLTADKSTSVTANNRSASSMLYGAGVIGVIIILLLLWTFWEVYSRSGLDETSINMVKEYFFGWSWFLPVLIFVLVIMMIVIILYAYSLIDAAIGTNSTARWIAFAAGILGIIVFIFLFIIMWQFYAYNAYLSALSLVPGMPLEPVVSPVVPLAPVMPVTPVITPTPANVLLFDRNPAVPGVFDGRVTVKGIIKPPPQYLNVNGRLVLNTTAQKNIDVDVDFPWDDTPVFEQPIAQQAVIQERVVNKPMLQQRIVNQPMVEQRLVNQPIQRQVQPRQQRAGVY